MRLFDPDRDLPEGEDILPLPGQGLDRLVTADENGRPLPPLPLFTAARAHPGGLIPRVEDCHALWDRYAVPPHIRAHSELVANLALAVAELALEQGCAVSPELTLAAGLLHDLGKMYCVEHGGSHAQIGASWVMRETGNGAVARAVLFHVYWPWDTLLEDCVADDAFFATMAVIYADKRVKHDSYVSLDERFLDLQKRYGVNEYARSRIEESRQQGKKVEAAFSRRLGVPLHEHIADRGRLVKRTSCPSG